MHVRTRAIGFQGGQVLSLRLLRGAARRPAHGAAGRRASAGTRSRPPTAPSLLDLGAGRLPARRVRRAPRRLLSARLPSLRGPRQRARPRALPARARRSRARRRRVRWVRRYSHLGEHGGGVARARRRRRARSTARGARAGCARRRRVGARLPAARPSIKLAIGRRRPAVEDLPAPDGHADRPVVPVVARDVVVRRRARVRRAAAAPGRSTRRRSRWRSRGSTSACTTRPTSPPAPRSAPSLGSLGAMKVGIVGHAQRGQVLAVQRADAAPGAEAANYPFTTIEPNVAVVPVARRAARRGRARRSAPRTSSRTRSTSTTSPGLVAGAHKGEGLGNKFLANIRETDALAARRPRAPRRRTSSTPRAASTRLRDIETIETELIYADLEQAERRHARVVREARGGDRAAIAEEAWLRDVIDGAAGRASRRAPCRCPTDAPDALRNLCAADRQAGAVRRQRRRGRRRGAGRRRRPRRRRRAPPRSRSPRASRPSCPSSTTRRPRAMREELGVGESGLHRVVRGAFGLLDLIAFFTAGEDKPAQSWHLRRGLHRLARRGRDPLRHPEAASCAPR